MVQLLSLKCWYLSLQNKTNCPGRTVKKLHALEYIFCEHPLFFPRHLASPPDITGCRTGTQLQYTFTSSPENETNISILQTTYLAWRPLFSGIFQEFWVTLTRLLVALRIAIHSASYSSESPALGSCSTSIIYLQTHRKQLFLLIPESD